MEFTFSFKTIYKKAYQENETIPVANGNEERNNNSKYPLLRLPYKGSDVIHISFT